jgi:glycosyltransferase involved in cell wall biosynthesis
MAIGAPESRIRVVPIGGVSLADIDRCAPSVERTDVIFVGRLTKPKGVDTLLRSIACLKAKSNVATSTIIGDGPERADLERLSAQLGISDRVSFLGRIEDDATVISLMKSARVFVYPAMPEGTWSVSVIEANACGLPAVSVRAGKLGMNEVVSDGFNGLLVAEQSAEAIADKLGFLLEHESMRADLVRNALAFAREQDWDVVAEKTDILYCEAMSAG